MGAWIDPADAALSAPPRRERDLVITAVNNRVLVYDNLSCVPPWLADALCRLATGGGFATRALYSDREETVFDVQRPVILTGIEELATRADLLDRSLVIELPRLQQDRRMAESAFWATTNPGGRPPGGCCCACAVGYDQVAATSSYGRFRKLDCCRGARVRHDRARDSRGVRPQSSARESAPDRSIARRTGGA